MRSFFPKAWDFVRHPTGGRTTAMLFILLLLVAIPLTVTLSQKQQEIRQRAAGEECKLDTTFCKTTYDTCILKGQPSVVGSSCESQYNSCQQQCNNTPTTSTKKYYTCNINSYDKEGCSGSPTTSIGAGSCLEEDISTNSTCNNLGQNTEGESFGSSQTVCFQDTTCAPSDNGAITSCVANCSQQKTICENNVTSPCENSRRTCESNAATLYNSCVSLQQSKQAAGEAAQKALQPAQPATQCENDSDCPSRGACQSSSCTNGNCSYTNKPAGTSCPDPATGEKTYICDSLGGCFPPDATMQTSETTPTPTPPTTPTVTQSTASCPDVGFYNDLISAYKDPNYLQRNQSIQTKLKSYLINNKAELLSFNLLKQAINNCLR